MEKERIASSGLHCEVCVVHFQWIKGEGGWIKSKVCYRDDLKIEEYPSTFPSLPQG